MAISMGINDREGLPRTPPDANQRAQAFELARQHTRLVRAMRVAFPIGAVLCLVFYGVVLTSGWKLGAGRLKVGEIELTPDDLTMKNPSYFGVTNDGSRYEVRAKRAVLEFNQQAPIKLFDVDGDMVQPNNVVTRLKSKRGLLDNAKAELELWDNIEIDASNGMSARLSRAKVFQKQHRVVSKEPVKARMPTGTVEGSTMNMQTDSRQTTFFGNVKAHLVESAPGQGTAAFGRNARQPVDVTSDQLHIDDVAKSALFSGKVVAVQGDSTLRTPELLIYYEGKAADHLTSAGSAQQDASSRLSRLFATNGSEVTAGSDRRITSRQADFDVKADTALFTGNVIATQVKNVLRGQRLFVERKTGRSRLESPPEAGQPAGRIAATFYQGESKTGQQKPKAAAAEAGSAVAEGMLGSFRTDPSAPMDVEADILDVYDNVKQAVFRGNVRSQQGDFLMRTIEMTAFYTGQMGLSLTIPDNAAASKEPGQLTRVVAKQRVLVTSLKDGQTATGDWAVYEAKSNTVLMGDHVIVTRGKDVAEGPQLKIDLTTGMYRFEVDSDKQAASVPATSSAPAATGPSALGAGPSAGSCPPGKQCILFYPKEAKEKANDLLKKAAPGATPATKDSAWEPSTSASPVQRSK